MGACVIIIMWVGTKEVSSHHLSPGSFAAFGAVSISIYSLLTRIGRTYTRFQISMKSCERVFDIFDKIPETSGEKPFPENFQQIEIRSLSFPYLRGVPVLENISLDISEGETILLKGSSGSGKTTLLRLLLGFYKPVSGSIVINSIPVTEYGLSSLRGKINMVPQETILFNDTIENNVIYGSFEKDEKRLNKALNLSRCDTFVPELEKGINTVTGDRGVKLSAGQKQRIAIARALLRGGTVLLLDEATSAIDEKTEKKILSNVINSGIFKTIVLVSHRSSLEKFADRIYSLEEGKARLIKDNRPEK
jgi:subfamily B ATP-binding cassette protein MsbA